MFAEAKTMIAMAVIAAMGSAGYFALQYLQNKDDEITSKTVALEVVTRDYATITAERDMQKRVIVDMANQMETVQNDRRHAEQAKNAVEKRLAEMDLANHFAEQAENDHAGLVAAMAYDFKRLLDDLAEASDYSTAKNTNRLPVATGREDDHPATNNANRN